MKKVASLLLLLASCFALESSAQKVFYGAGFAAGVSHSIPSITIFSVGSRLNPSERTFVYGAGVRLDAPLFPVADEMSIGFHLEPSLAYSIPFSFDMDNSALITQTPLMAQFNYGNYSSINSTKELGFGVALGALSQYHYRFTDSSTDRQFGKSFLFLPAAQASIRFWSKSNSLYVISLTHAIGSEQYGMAQNNRSASLLSVSRIINY